MDLKGKRKVIFISVVAFSVSPFVVGKALLEINLADLKSSAKACEVLLEKSYSNDNINSITKFTDFINKYKTCEDKLSYEINDNPLLINYIAVERNHLIELRRMMMLNLYKQGWLDGREYARLKGFKWLDYRRVNKVKYLKDLTKEYKPLATVVGSGNIFRVSNHEIMYVGSGATIRRVSNKLYQINGKVIKVGD